MRTLILFIALALVVPAASAQDATPEAAESAASEPLLARIRAQTVRLEAREQELEARERAVAELEREAIQILDDARSLRFAIERRLEEWEELKGDRVARLAKVYSEMPPKQAAPLLESLGQDLATEVIARMKPKDSAGILALMSKPSALRISRSVAKPLTPTDGGPGGR